MCVSFWMWVEASIKCNFSDLPFHCLAGWCSSGGAGGSAAWSREEAGAAEGGPQERDEQHQREIPGWGQRVFTFHSCLIHALILYNFQYSRFQHSQISVLTFLLLSNRMAIYGNSKMLSVFVCSRRLLRGSACFLLSTRTGSVSRPHTLSSWRNSACSSTRRYKRHSWHTRARWDRTETLIY